MKNLFTFTFFALLISFSTSVSNLAAPVIGILTQPSKYGSQGYNQSNWSYIAGGYDSMLQAAGAHVIPIQWDLPLANITALLSQIDGVYFPGGSASLWDATTMNKTDFGLAVNNILTQIIQINTNGDFLPFMGTCLGMSMIATAFAPNLTLYLPGVDVWNVSKPIFFTALLKTSTLFETLDSNTISEMQTLNMAFFHTMFLINSTIWFQNNTLSGNFSVTAVAIDGNNTSFAAVIEGIHMPVYATQFHYEKKYI